MLNTRASREFWLLALMALLVLGAGLGLRDPWPSDEPRFALVAKQMVTSGDWLFPHRGTELYSDKPPMLMWSQAILYRLIGDWRVAFLLPSLLAALGTLACVYDLGRRLWTRRVGLYAAWALLFAVHFTFQSKKAQIDPLVVFFITLANYGLLRHLLCGPAWRWWWLGWFAAGLGVITKGVGVLALLMIVPAATASLLGWPRVRLHIRDARFWLAPLAFVLAIAMWFVPMVLTALGSGSAEYRAYLDDILFRQTAKRYAQSWDHHQPWWYFLATMPSMWLPAFLVLPWAVPAWWRRLRRRDPRYLMLLGWWLLIVLFFSIPHGKRDVYILPALPMFCLALAPLLPGLLRRRDVQWLMGAFTAVLALALLGVGIAMLGGEPGFERSLIIKRGIDTAVTSGLAWIGIALGCGAVMSLVFSGRRRFHVAAIATLAMAWVAYGLIGYPLFNDSSSARGLMQQVGQRIGPDAELGLVAWKEQNLLMADRAATTFGFNRRWDNQLRDGVEWQMQAPAQRWLLVQEDALLGCVDRDSATLAGVANRRRWWLVRASDIRGPCTATAAEQKRERELHRIDGDE
ncbi:MULTISPECIES: glycosyltransferase family 39 protein [Stenotrophomonas]|uniref:Glycosyltransferase family 39 protein n=1 Tax=Stenotrophomonas maltophilia TaxID=40324 RepID=A0A4S2D0Q1_STEMA|nr:MULTISPECIES: glycosyltransferase family 39 protein [Stenotrophomonas]MBD3828382.1 glycosyltransferase family 39 protein [Stenotrophomonas sp.]QIO89660.1 dolichyl-phosphate-mannose--protein [Stenotrophomonas rhizophila]TGY34431.1 glycosyltransferase family 39 protein [Stenotrophomonas maltophilia]